MPFEIPAAAGTLAQARAAAVRVVKQATSLARNRYSTPGKDETYRLMEAEARAILAGESYTPFCLAEKAAALGIALSDYAATIVAAADATRTGLAAIEVAEASGRASIRDAGTTTAIEAAALAAQQALQDL